MTEPTPPFDKLEARMKIAVRLSVFLDNFIQPSFREPAVSALMDIIELNNQLTHEESKVALRDAVELMKTSHLHPQP